MKLTRLPLVLAALAAACGCAPAFTQSAAPAVKSATGSAKVTTASGIVFESLQAGQRRLAQGDRHRAVHYRGTFPMAANSTARTSAASPPNSRSTG
jgi:hypothetical protein